MNLKNLINDILFYVSVPKCVACKTRLLKNENSLCAACLDKYKDLLRFDCSLCGKPLNKCECSTSYLKTHYVHKVIKVFRYIPENESPGNMLIYSLKRDNRSDVLDFISGEVYKSIIDKKLALTNTVITNVPRRRASIRKYGYDHAKILTKSLAKQLNIEYCDLLVSKSKKDQKTNQGKEERMKNVDFDYKKFAKDIKGKNVIIVDDVITSGASIGKAAMLLHGLGAKKIYAAAISVAYFDDYVPIIYKDSLKYR